MNDAINLPEPDAYIDDRKLPQPHCVTSLNYCSAVDVMSGRHLEYLPVYTADTVQRLIAKERAEVARLTAERDALKADAERYRYLRNRVPAEVMNKRGAAAGCWIDCEDATGRLTLVTGDDADKDIDAARAQGGGNG